jgi:Dyp-type peroxidase family
MAVGLNAPLTWKTATGDDATMLEHLQPNIVKAHVRNHLVVLFIQFGSQADAQAEAKQFLAALVPLTKSAKTHLEEVDAFKASQQQQQRPPQPAQPTPYRADDAEAKPYQEDYPQPTPSPGGGAKGTPYLGVGLSKAGYDALGISNIPTDSSFQAGMKAQQSLLADPPSSEWEQAYQGDIHAIILIGDAEAEPVSALRDQVAALLPPSITLLGEETGLGQNNPSGVGIEHFGYVDGRSQPLVLQEEIDDERQAVGDDAWDPAFPLGQVIVEDPAAPDPATNFGSYFVFRKLEQDVRAFKEAEEMLADQLGLIDEDRERAGAMLVGRFEDGTPVTLHDAANGNPVANNFDYDGDPDGAKCPFHGHIRKTNPRGSGGFGQSEDSERRHLMARRGQTYGVRTDDPSADLPPEERPSGGVGLLFMAFNVDLGNQFEFTQARWADADGFPQVPTGAHAPGLDPVIGQGPRPKMSNPTVWGDGPFQETDAIPQAVHMKGGEYFFTPSLAFLSALS